MQNLKNLPSSLEETLKSYAESKYPNEACGLIIEQDGDLKFIPCDNLSYTPEKNFVIDSSVFLKYSRVLYSVFHSHVSGRDRAVSLKDIKLCESLNRAGTIVFVDKNAKKASKVYWYGSSVFNKEYHLREYVYNVYDCFTLMRDYYLKEFNYKLKFVYSDFGWWINAKYDESLYLSNYEKLGFREVNKHGELQKGDILLMRLGRCICMNHAAIYDGGRLIFHHIATGISRKDPLSKYEDRVDKVMRNTFDKKNEYAGDCLIR